MDLSEFLYAVVLKPRPLRAAANFLLRRIVRPMCSVGGARIALDREDPVVSGALTLGVYERPEIAFFLEHFRPGDRFIDIGANVGLYTGLALHRGAASVLAVEPHPRAFACLEKTVAANPSRADVSLENVAAGGRAETATLHCNPENHGDNRLYGDPLLGNTIPCAIETLDTLCRKHNLAACDFLKIDVQGFEMHVLEGAAGLLAASKDCVLMTEFWPYGLTRAGSDPGAYLSVLEKSGFRLLLLSGGRLREFDPAGLSRQTTGRQYRSIIGFRGNRTPPCGR